MKKVILMAFMAVSATSFAQTPVKNGTIYKTHPYITIVNEMTAAYVKNDTVAMAAPYADSAKFFDSPSPKRYSLTEAKANWRQIHNEWEQITIKPRGYPDGLDYTTDGFVVQSWWIVTAVNKKTKKTATFEQVIFDTFTKAGKIGLELNYYDTSSIIEAMKP